MLHDKALLQIHITSQQHRTLTIKCVSSNNNNY